MNRIVYIVAIIFCWQPASSQKLSKIVTRIAKVNEVQHERIGFGGQSSEQYERFELLKSKASMEDLVKLTQHRNAAVAGYASWGLVDKSYQKLDEILYSFLSNDRKVATFSGCIKDRSPISSILYHRYWNKVRSESENEISTLQNDALLLKMDSLILFQKNVYWLILDRALHNRIYTSEYLPQIKKLAFENGNLDAIEYIFRHQLQGNEIQLQRGLIKHLNRKKVWPSEYELIFEFLLSFREPELNQVVLKELEQIDKKGIHPSSKRYDYILKKYGIKRKDKN